MIYFRTETYLKTNTPITANVDVTDVTPYIATQAQLFTRSLQWSNTYQR